MHFRVPGTRIEQGRTGEKEEKVEGRAVVLVGTSGPDACSLTVGRELASVLLCGLIRPPFAKGAFQLPLRIAAIHGPSWRRTKRLLAIFRKAIREEPIS